MRSPTRPQSLDGPAEHEADDLQHVPASARVSARAGALALQILARETTLTGAVEAVGALFSSCAGVDLVVAMLTQHNPEPATSWVHLDERAWLREWSSPGSVIAVTPGHDAGADDALTLPWLSQKARRDVVIVPDVDRMPAAADRDRRELTACGARAIVSRSMVSDGTLLGSIAFFRATPGAWPEEYVADLRLLTAALASRMVEARASNALADALKRGDLARASQHEFFSAMGHELRTPIAAIVGTAELLGMDAAELAEAETAHPAVDHPAQDQSDVHDRFARGVAKDARVLLSAGEQLLAIVDDLLETAQELGTAADTECVDVSEAAADVIHWLRAAASSNDVTVVNAVEAGTRVLATPSGLRQILSNLVGNAIAYNLPGGSVRVTATDTADELGQPRIRIRVHDTGPGLTREQQEEVFKPFVRFAGQDKRGTGLGLSLSRSLAERDGGSIGVESQPGAGATFWVDLAAATADDDEGAVGDRR
jgi:signal transduction histidine kinase